MKQVVRENRPPVTPLERVSIFNIYGVIIADRRLIIVRENFGNGEFVVRSINRLTEGGSFTPYSVDLKTLIDYLLNQGYSVYEFSNGKELMKWLSEDNS